MEEGGGIVRSERAAVEALKTLNNVRNRLNNVRISDGGRVYNMELRELLELDGMLLAAEAVLLGALLRQESRGRTTGWSSKAATTRGGLSTASTSYTAAM
jgi:succinate dehydrogenase / fumarate reductase flavoprotein subunit